jgi:hypothetical protein
VCDPPKCVVVCPTVQCEHEECPQCKTVCAPPNCHTDCGDNCESTCADPQCHWSCKPSPSCLKPSCKLDCSDEKICNLNSDVNARPTPPLLPGGQVVAQGLAYILPQSEPLGPGQGPLFMPGAFAPEINATNGTVQPPLPENSPPPEKDDRAFFLRNDDGKGGMPMKGR